METEIFVNISSVANRWAIDRQSFLNEEGCSCPLQGLPHPVSVACKALCFTLCYTVGAMQTASNQAHASRM